MHKGHAQPTIGRTTIYLPTIYLPCEAVDHPTSESTARVDSSENTTWGASLAQTNNSYAFIVPRRATACQSTFFCRVCPEKVVSFGELSNMPGTGGLVRALAAGSPRHV